MVDHTVKIIILGEDKASDELGAVNKAMGGLGKAALAMGAVGATAITGIGVGLAKLAIDAAPLADIKVSFEEMATAAGSSADEVLAAFKKQSAGTITNAAAMETYNQATMLVSSTFAETLPEALGYLSKVSAATGTDMDFLLSSLTTGVGRLSPMILDNLSIQVDLVKAYEDWSAASGIAVADMTKEEQQAALTAQVMELLAENTAALPDVTANASTKMAAMKATFIDVKNTIGMALVPILSSLLQTFSNLANQVLPPLIKFIETSLVPILDTAAFFIDSLVAALMAGQSPAEALQGALADIGLDEVAVFVGGVVTGIQNLIDIVAPVIETIVEWVMQNVGLKDILIVLGIAIASVVLPALAGILVSILAIAAPIVALIAVVALLRKVWKTDFGGIRTVLTDFWENTAKPAFEALVEWLQINIPIAIEVLKGFWENTLLPALEKVWAFIQDSIFPIFETVVLWLAENIPVAIQAAADFWENTLKPALEAVWAFITDSIFPAFETIVEWLAESIPVAIQTVSDFWEDTLKPALETVWAFIQDEIIPIFKIVVDWLASLIPVALQTLSDFWENVLKPALEIVWDFVQTSLIPLFEALVELFDVALTLALTALAGLWQNVLKPALETVWNFIKDNLQPVLATLKDMIEVGLKTAIDVATPILTGLKNAFDSIKSAIQPVIDFINKLKDALASIPIPDILTPGSPTPFELGLLGIGEAIEKMPELSFPVSVDGAFSQALPAGDMGAGGPMGTTAIDTATPILAGLKNAFNSIKSALQPVIDFIEKTKDALAGITLPDWLTPFELGLLGIGETIEKLPDLSFPVSADGEFSPQMGQQALVKGAIQPVIGFVDKMKDALTNVTFSLLGFGEAIEKLKDPSTFINKLKDALANIPLPDLGSLDIGKAIQKLPELSFPVSVGGAFSQAVPAGGGGGPAGTTVIIHNYFGDGSIRSERDVISVAEKTEKAFRLRGLRTL